MLAGKFQSETLFGRRHLNIRGKSANLPAITEKDWLDLKFGIDVGVDYYALSFVRNADVIYELKAYLAQQGEQLAQHYRHSLVGVDGEKKAWKGDNADGCILFVSQELKLECWLR